MRLPGIDAPENAQPFGNRSKQKLAELTFPKHAAVETRKLGRYGGILA